MIEHANDMLGYLATVHSSDPGRNGPITDHALLLADSSEVSTGGLKSWLKDNVIGIIFIAGAAAAGLGALKSNASRVLSITALLLVVLFLVGISGSAATQQTMSQFLLGLIGL